MDSSLIHLDRQYIWRPYTSTDNHQSVDPLIIQRAEGVWLTDAAGKRYIDGNGSWWTNTLGHAHPRLKQALQRQSEALMHCAFAGITHAPAVHLARELIHIAPPGMARVFFSDNGSTAVEVATKIAFQYWQQNGQPQRRHFIALTDAFHGDTLGSTSLGGIPAFRKVFGPLLFDLIRAPEPGDNGDYAEVIDAIIKELSSHGSRIAGIVIEPLLQGAAGMRMWPPTLLTALSHAAKQAETFLIADEVFTGYGRTGSMWACDHADITPDILCTAKAFSGGVLPMAATITTQRVFDGFSGGSDRAFMHGHTYYGNPLGAAVAREVLAVYRDERVVEQVNAKAPIIRAAFERIAQLPGVKSVRSLGMVGAADLGNAGYQGQIGWQVYQQALQMGAYLRPLGDTVYIAPPLVISQTELAQLLEILHAAIVAAYKNNPWSS